MSMRLALFLLTAPLVTPLVRAQEATNFRIEFRILESRGYQEKELIPVTLRVLGRPERVDVPPPLPQERPAIELQFRGFLVDPPIKIGNDSCGTEDRPCSWGTGIYATGGVAPSRFEVDFNKIGDTSSTVLNDYTGAAIPPGRYRMSALARKMFLVRSGPMSASYDSPNPPDNVISNAVEVQVVPMTSQFMGQAIASAVSIIQSEKDEKNYEKARNAAKQLAYLDAPAAWAAILDLLPAEEGLMLSQLSATSKPGPVCDLLQARIPAPAQVVSSQYLTTMTSVCSRANLPPQPPPSRAGGRLGAVVVSTAPVPAARFAAATPDPEQQAYFEKQRAYMEDLRLRSANALAASLTQKQAGPPKVVAMKTLLEHISQLQNNRPRGATPGWAPQLAQALASSLTSLSREDRRELLPLFASVLPTPSAAPAFEAVLNNWKPNGYVDEQNEALRALYRVDPRRAKERIVAELTKLTNEPDRADPANSMTWLEPSALQLLPASDAPPMDEILIKALTRPQQPGMLAAPILLTTAIARFATPQALPRVQAIYESQNNKCQPELLAYFLRVDEAYASQILRSTATQSCLPQYFQRTASLIMNPTLEEFVTPYLMNGSVYLKIEAAKSLGKYGSPAAEKPLWNTLRYFHEYWDGKGAELAKNGEGLVLEEQLAFAIAHGRGWITTQADLQTIQKLCIGERCLFQNGQALQGWVAPMNLNVFDSGVRLQAYVAQYGFDNLSELEAKLAQFPGGTSFLMTVSGPSYDTIEESLRRVASTRSLLLQTR
jgi:hypothetical protein